ncbi:hypothetical protein BJV85_001782 [Clostridium acetobutylicum]|uniref:Uncharacterized protein n=1 Tax=Clostridium acetobutylicum (strain ATCC 824 / DSM 792 / JCM 1419 / IAM 19013 / LMG 5710 / NBRC 13948 / NRRL B-527 / VKM B-1787 / 2291 / W) TaxID=272562 RepID=Q97HB5_CLOAB|nr:MULTISPECIES: hypothetical protein [Clostridium]AAK80056.1 Hypothetical protein CA_C2097 [Clostridium acetobutylicum ATCC 824]ADZ21148.1 Conserved hypothetical protein [Clostridium acetobutylicum EA 2018]AEI32179.1 hypothetical protein SMB_G2130 [Clostridium acetobutylicum DSM 1731]AWV79516.1 hypothetical protein DK921_05260 [Clostridium acetobutylicum]MBC2394510.1 hypothetical protein [Clostridium acetobutylicum]
MSENNFLPYEIKIKKYNKKNFFIFLIILSLVILNVFELAFFYLNSKVQNTARVYQEKSVINRRDVTRKEINEKYEESIEKFFNTVDKLNWDTVCIKDNIITFSLICDSDTIEGVIYDLEKNKKFIVKDVAKDLDKSNCYNLSVRVKENEE